MKIQGLIFLALLAYFFIKLFIKGMNEIIPEWFKTWEPKIILLVIGGIFMFWVITDDTNKKIAKYEEEREFLKSAFAGAATGGISTGTTQQAENSVGATAAFKGRTEKRDKIEKN